MESGLRRMMGSGQIGDARIHWRKVDRPDATIHYMDSSGSDRSVVLLHGLAGYGGEWSTTIEHLSPGWRCLALDQRGHGRSTRRPDDMSRRALVDDVIAVIEG